MSQTRLPIRATAAMKELMAAHFRGLDAAASDPTRRVAWCTSVGPAELLRAMGFDVYFPENHGALLGASRVAGDVIPSATSAGYSPDICSYLTSDIGAFLEGTTPLTRAYGIASVPRPDVLVYSTNQCRDVQHWFGWYARHWGVPMLGVQAPCMVRELTEDHVRYVADQFRRIAEELAPIAGAPLDLEAFRHRVALSAEATLLWQEVLELARNRPAPLTFFDGTIHMAPIVVLRGTREAVDYYSLLLAELRQRVAGGVGAIGGERARLYWDGMPIWGKLRELDEIFRAHDACVVASTYCNSWCFPDFDPADPFLSTARAYTRLFITRSDEQKERTLERMLSDFHIDGVIYHEAKTCPNNSNTMYGLPGRLSDRTGVPHVVLHGDLNDLRCYSEEQGRTLIEAFLEVLRERPG